MAVTEWQGDGRPAFVPTWIPSVQALQMAFPASIENMKANLTRPTKSKKEAAIECVLVLLEVIAFLMMLLGIVPGVPPWGIPEFVGIALFVVGAFYFVTAAATVGVKLSFLPSTLPSSEPNSTSLITEGVYAHCRHPMYLGTLAASLGFSMLTLSFGRLFWTTVLYITLEIKADAEELILNDQFEKYADYAARTPKFVPGINRLITGRDETAASFNRLEEGGRVDEIAE